MKNILVNPVVVACTLFATIPIAFFSCSGCTTTKNRELSPTGVYQGDTLLYSVDANLKMIRENMQVVFDLAERNPEFFAQNETASKILNILKAEVNGVEEPTDILAKVYRARDAYVASRSIADAETLTEQNLEMIRRIQPLITQIIIEVID